MCQKWGCKELDSDRTAKMTDGIREYFYLFPPTSLSPPLRLVIISPLVVRRGKVPLNVFKRRLWNSITLPCEI